MRVCAPSQTPHIRLARIGDHLLVVVMVPVFHQLLFDFHPKWPRFQIGATTVLPIRVLAKLQLVMHCVDKPLGKLSQSSNCAPVSQNRGHALVGVIDLQCEVAVSLFIVPAPIATLPSCLPKNCALSGSARFASTLAAGKIGCSINLYFPLVERQTIHPPFSHSPFPPFRFLHHQNHHRHDNQRQRRGYN